VNTVTTSKTGCERRQRYLEENSPKLLDAEETQGGIFAAVASGSELRPHYVSSFPRPVPSRIDRHDPINDHSHKFIGRPVLKLDDLMPLSRQLPQLVGFATRQIFQ
jgi:hypothetical protein